MAKKYPKLSKILKKLLFDKDMKVIDLARQVKLPQPTIHRLVTGKSTRPYKTSLEPIADYFSLSVDQLLGVEEINADKKISESKKLSKVKTKYIPIISWDLLNNLEEAKRQASKQIVVTKNLSSDAFALTMTDYSMEPLFPKDSILIFDPDARPTDRSFVLAHLPETNCHTFRQLLIDEEIDAHYLKPLSPELNNIGLRPLGSKNNILAKLVESRFTPEY